MAEFGKYAPLLRQLEGGFVDDPDDAGGATYAGVTLKVFRSYYGGDRTVEDLKAISNIEWCNIMKTGYWNRLQADRIGSQGVAEILADWAVNSGVRTAVKGVQRLLGVRQDGIVGDMTIAAINGEDPQRLFYDIKAARKQYYIDIVERKTSNAKFLKGWLNRLEMIEYR